MSELVGSVTFGRNFQESTHVFAGLLESLFRWAQLGERQGTLRELESGVLELLSFRVLLQRLAYVVTLGFSFNFR